MFGRRSRSQRGASKKSNFRSRRRDRSDRHDLPPSWVEYLKSRGVDAVHWSSLGDPRAKDSILMEWARTHRCIVFTHDLDFSALIATTASRGPSIIQVRTQDVLPSAIGQHVVKVLNEHLEELDRGAIITIDEVSERIRILPLHRIGGETGAG